MIWILVRLGWFFALMMFLYGPNGALGANPWLIGVLFGYYFHPRDWYEDP